MYLPTDGYPLVASDIFINVCLSTILKLLHSSRVHKSLYFSHIRFDSVKVKIKSSLKERVPAFHTSSQR